MAAAVTQQELRMIRSVELAAETRVSPRFLRAWAMAAPSYC